MLASLCCRLVRGSFGPVIAAAAAALTRGCRDFCISLSPRCRCFLSFISGFHCNNYVVRESVICAHVCECIRALPSISKYV